MYSGRGNSQFGYADDPDSVEKTRGGQSSIIRTFASHSQSFHLDTIRKTSHDVKLDTSEI